MRPQREIRVQEEERKLLIGDARYEILWDEAQERCMVKIPRNTKQYRQISARNMDELRKKVCAAMELSLGEMGLRECDLTVKTWYGQWKKMEEVRVVTSVMKHRDDLFWQAMDPFWSDTPVQSFNEADTDRWYQWMRENLITAEGNPDDGKIRNAWSNFRVMMQRATDVRYLPYNPVPLRKIVVQKESPNRLILSKMEQQMIWERRFDYPYGSLLALGLVTGMRRGELAGVMIRDYERERGVMYVQRQIKMETRGEGEVEAYTNRTKTGKRRTIHLTEEARELLEEIIRIRREREPAFLTPDSDGFLFVSSLGLRLVPNEINEEVKARLASINAEIHPHALRRTFATEYYKNHGRDLDKVANELGVTPQTAMIYIVECPEGEKFVANALASVFSRGPEKGA